MIVDELNRGMCMSQSIIQHNRIQELGELKLVGFRVLCPGDQYVVEIPLAAERLQERTKKIKHIVNPSQQYGAFIVENDSHDEDGYWVCVEVREYETIPADMVTLTIPRQRYAVTRHKGSNLKIVETYNELHNWIKEKDFTRLTDKWHLERFYSWNNPKNLDVDLLDTIK
jgi:predicted transcriptional regulator YdeE